MAKTPKDAQPVIYHIECDTDLTAARIARALRREGTYQNVSLSRSFGVGPAIVVVTHTAEPALPEGATKVTRFGEVAIDEPTATTDTVPEDGSQVRDTE